MPKYEIKDKQGRLLYRGEDHGKAMEHTKRAQDEGVGAEITVTEDRPTGILQKAAAVPWWVWVGAGIAAAVGLGLYLR